jgi:ADP-ribose pyrophosphatase
MAGLEELHPSSISPWLVIGPDTSAYDGFVKIIRRPLQMPSGTQLEWDMLQLPDTVAVLALVGESQVVLVRQYRPGPHTLVTSMPGGFLDVGETPLQAAARELVEETGYQAATFEYLTAVRANSATNVQHLVVARGCVPTGAQQFDEFEECEVLLTELADFRRWLREEQIGARELSYLALDLLGCL